VPSQNSDARRTDRQWARAAGDARIINHLLVADWQNKVWKYGLPADQRLKME